jgi:hypothetical protein
MSYHEESIEAAFDLPCYCPDSACTDPAWAEGYKQVLERRMSSDPGHPVYLDPADTEVVRFFLDPAYRQAATIERTAPQYHMTTDEYGEQKPFLDDRLQRITVHRLGIYGYRRLRKSEIGARCDPPVTVSRVVKLRYKTVHRMLSGTRTRFLKCRYRNHPVCSDLQSYPVFMAMRAVAYYFLLRLRVGSARGKYVSETLNRILMGEEPVNTYRPFEREWVGEVYFKPSWENKACVILPDVTAGLAEYRVGCPTGMESLWQDVVKTAVRRSSRPSGQTS